MCSQNPIEPLSLSMALLRLIQFALRHNPHLILNGFIHSMTEPKHQYHNQKLVLLSVILEVTHLNHNIPVLNKLINI